MKYFAYGSNMLEQRLKARKRVPLASFLSNASVTGYRLRFHKKSKDCSGKCNIARTDSPRDIVYGVLFEMPDDDLFALDKAEGVGQGYHRQDVSVMADGRDISALAYIADADYINEALVPYRWYHELVIAGAIQHTLSKDYIAGLRAVPYTNDPDSTRATKVEAEEVLREFYESLHKET
jgi:gamma-glutamylcyclotransferase